jgi:predicted helicase
MPPEIVDFMCASVAEVLQTEFGLTLGSRGVNILDPSAGNGFLLTNSGTKNCFRRYPLAITVCDDYE